MDSTRRHIAVIGGGTGTFTALSGLKRFHESIDLSAIVTMADSGGSTGRLRDEFGYLPVGDVRMALVALADDDYAYDKRMRELFLYRFEKGGPDLVGHNFGNLLLVALTDILGSEKEAIRFASRMLHSRGSVHPVTTDHVTLVATYDDGSVVRGEDRIDDPESERFERRIVHLACEPRGEIDQAAETTIREADLIVLGPGDLFTSVLAVCVVGGVREALRDARGRIVFVSNLMTKRGQTTDMSLEDHVRAIETYIGRSVDTVLANSTPLPESLIMRYEGEGELPVLRDGSREVVLAELLSPVEHGRSNADVLRRSLIRHDPQLLADALIRLL